MTLLDTILIGLSMLLGTEDIDYFIFKRDPEEWERVSWLHRN